MDVVDLYLYAGFAAGWLVGRWRPSRSPWVARSTIASVVALLALLGASFRSIAARQLADVLPGAVVFAAAILAATAGVYLVLRRAAPVGRDALAEAAVAPRDRFPTSGLLLVALLLGYAAGRTVVVPTSLLIPAALVVLLGLVGYGIELSLASVRRAWLPIASALGGAVLVALAAELVARLPGEAAFATATIADAFGPERGETAEFPITGAEDFSFVLNEVPGAFVFLGACPPDRDPESAPTNHSALALFDDAALAEGTALYAELALRRLARG